MSYALDASESIHFDCAAIVGIDASRVVGALVTSSQSGLEGGMVAGSSEGLNYIKLVNRMTYGNTLYFRFILFYI